MSRETTMILDGQLREIHEDGHVIIPELEPSENHIYTVWSTFNHGKTFELLYKGRLRQKATDTANFWDERQDTHFVDHVIPMDAVSVANRKFDVLVDSLKNPVRY
jgi:hypothetical protein